MSTRSVVFSLALLGLLGALALSNFKKASSGQAMSKAAQDFLATLDEDQRAECQLKFDTPKRLGWHFIPKEDRKGVQLRDMNEKQRKAAHTLLATSLSELGYTKAVKVMELEEVLAILEGDEDRSKRDALKYYFTVFGDPQPGERWGLSVEGHHLSFNYVVDDGQVVASTPQFLGANPTVVRKNYKTTKHVKKGDRVLKKEETLAFDLVNSFDKKQSKQAIIAEKAPREIRAAGEPHPPQAKPAGLAVKNMKTAQRETLENLVEEYIAAMPADVARRRREKIEKAGFENVHFAWAGATKPGVGHYYRVQGPTFLIEFVNTQPDAAGNPASHIHCIWRDPDGDFGVKAK